MPSLRERLDRSDTIILDGGMGEAIAAAGIDVRNPLWGSVALLDASGLAINDGLHRAYRAAGAEILIANTHNGSLAHCERFADGRHDPVELMHTVNRRGIESARRAGGIVAGCLASPDEPYAERASLSPDEISEALRPQRDSLVQNSPDLLIYEMLTTDSDVRGVAALVDDEVDVAIGLVCREDGRLLSGLSIADAVAAFFETAVIGFFVQCTSMAAVTRALDELLANQTSSQFVGVYANDGRRYDGAWHGEGASPRAYAEAAVGWQRQGARVIGGCCGTGPAHIAELTRRLRAP